MPDARARPRSLAIEGATRDCLTITHHEAPRDVAERFAGLATENRHAAESAAGRAAAVAEFIAQAFVADAVAAVCERKARRG